MGNVIGEEAEVKNKKKLHQVAEIMDPFYFFGLHYLCMDLFS